jgi:putative hydrolase
MRLLCDCHIHTLASGHAYSTISECLAVAAARGLELVAITDHGPAGAGAPHVYYFNNLKVLPPVIQGVRVLKGAEANLTGPDGAIDLDPAELSHIEYVVASMHDPLFPRMGREETTRALIKAMANPWIKAIGHPDDSRFPLDPVELARAAADAGVFLEVNNSSLRPTSYRIGARDNYLALLDACVRFGTRIIVDSDAHWQDDVGRFDEARELLATAGFPESQVANTSAARLLGWLR